jgi:membrane protease YdiL (CAAX protease family)
MKLRRITTRRSNNTRKEISNAKAGPGNEAGLIFYRTFQTQRITLGVGMKSCDYCGKQNEDALVYCAECGTELTPEDLAPPRVSGAARVLDVKTVTIILVAVIVAQVAAGVLTALVAELFQPAETQYFPRSAKAELEAIMPVVVMGMMIGGAAAMLIATIKFKLPVKDTNPEGAAWVLGPNEAIVKGVGIGMLISLASQILSHFFGRQIDYRQLDDVTRMAFKPGLSIAVYAVAAVFLAPPLEEMLFRGLLFGGFCRSLGLDRAAIGTTAIFVLLHAAQLAIQPLATIGITAMAIAALWLRLRHRAVGAAVAVHFGFNALTTLRLLLQH